MNTVSANSKGASSVSDERIQWNLCQNRHDQRQWGRGIFQPQCVLLATMLDPEFGLNWVDLDVRNGKNATSIKNFREDLKKILTGIHTYILHREKNSELAL